jgi:hypothetical protein
MKIVELSAGELTSVVGGQSASDYLDFERALRLLPALEAKAAGGQTAAERDAFAGKVRDLKRKYGF